MTAKIALHLNQLMSNEPRLKNLEKREMKIAGSQASHSEAMLEKTQVQLRGNMMETNLVFEVSDTTIITTLGLRFGR